MICIASNSVEHYFSLAFLRKLATLGLETEDNSPVNFVLEGDIIHW